MLLKHELTPAQWESAVRSFLIDRDGDAPSHNKVLAEVRRYDSYTDNELPAALEKELQTRLDEAREKINKKYEQDRIMREGPHTGFRR